MVMPKVYATKKMGGALRRLLRPNCRWKRKLRLRGLLLRFVLLVWWRLLLLSRRWLLTLGLRWTLRRRLHRALLLMLLLLALLHLLLLLIVLPL
jgi:hypothetical protein